MPTDGQKKVDWNVLDTALVRLRSQLTQFEDTGTALQGEIQSKLGGAWTGDASFAYQGAYSKWNKGYTDSKDALQQLITALTGALDLHRQREGERASMNSSF